MQLVQFGTEQARAGSECASVKQVVGSSGWRFRRVTDSRYVVRDADSSNAPGHRRCVRARQGVRRCSYIPEYSSLHRRRSCTLHSHRRLWRGCKRVAGVRQGATDRGGAIWPHHVVRSSRTQAAAHSICAQITTFLVHSTAAVPHPAPGQRAGEANQEAGMHTSGLRWLALLHVGRNGRQLLKLVTILRRTAASVRVRTRGTRWLVVRPPRRPHAQRGAYCHPPFACTNTNGSQCDAALQDSSPTSSSRYCPWQQTTLGACAPG